MWASHPRMRETFILLMENHKQNDPFSTKHEAFDTSNHKPAKA